MTEAQIERRVEMMFNALDARLMRGDLTQAAYDAESKAISAWADHQYEVMDRVALLRSREA